jgi:putative DNA primase/helicase
MSERDDAAQVDLQNAVAKAQPVEERIRRHYSRDGVGDVYRTLGTIQDDGLSIGNSDFVGWYRTRDAAGDAAEGRPWSLSREWGRLRRDVDRVVYATISYASRDWFVDAWQRYSWTGGGSARTREWDSGTSPTPDYSDLTAYAPFADIDLADDVKHKRAAGDIPRSAVEDALARYIGAFADLAGGREHVFALDSVGGAYVFVAPTSTGPIATTFPAEERAAIFSAMMDKLNAWLGDVRDEITADIPATEGVFAPDKLNNKNRLFKAPLSVHSSLDGVVTPISTDAVRYDFTPLTAVDGALIDETVEWADGFTDDHTDALGSIVATLWPEIRASADSWRDALATVAEKELADEDAGANGPSRNDDPGEDADSTTANGHTKQKRQVFRAVDALDAEDVVKDLCDEWDVGNREPPRFAPGYRGSDSGTSCFVNHEGKIVDLDDEVKAFGVVTYTAREKSIITADDTATGSDWWAAVEELRKAGYDIPRYTGDDEFSDYYAYPLAATAREHGYGDPFEDDAALLRACLALRDEYDALADATPPYAALVALAEHVGLDFADPDERILGKTAHNVAGRMFDDFGPADLDSGDETKVKLDR